MSRRKRGWSGGWRLLVDHSAFGKREGQGNLYNYTTSGLLTNEIYTDFPVCLSCANKTILIGRAFRSVTLYAVLKMRDLGIWQFRHG